MFATAKLLPFSVVLDLLFLLTGNPTESSHLASQQHLLLKHLPCPLGDQLILHPIMASQQLPGDSYSN